MTANVSIHDFDRPPVGEVALSVQFDPLKQFNLHHFGLSWQHYKERYPSVEAQSPLAPVFETFEKKGAKQPSVRVELVEGPALPRAWFVSEDRTEIVQVQHDRFIVNWRRVRASDVYPRYSSLRARFVQEFSTFSDFIESQNLGTLVPNQCEVTYVNQIESGGAWTHHDEVAKVLNLWAGHFKSDFLSEPETIRLGVRYLIGANDKGKTQQPQGRLHVEFQPAFRLSDGAPIFVMNLTARGIPQNQTVNGVLAFFDLGREYIVKGFASLTTDIMQTEWGRHG